MKHPALWTPLLCLACAHAAAADFAAYSTPLLPGTHSPHVVLSDEKSRQYADELTSGADQKVNFAGHYILAIWGCGASCVMGAAIDAQTGTIAWLPFTVCCWAREVAEPMEYKPDSRLLIVHGSRNEAGDGTHFYVFDGHSFTPAPGAGGGSASSPPGQ